MILVLVVIGLVYTLVSFPTLVGNVPVAELEHDLPHIIPLVTIWLK